MADAPDAVALAWLPLVGIAIGGVAGLAAWGVSFVAPESFVIATAFGLTIVASGAVHLDGFLDSCDALVASVPPERRLEIMKDPRHGTFAVAGLAVAAVWWLAGLVAIPAAVLPWALAFAGGAARLASVLNAYAIPYGRAGASARTFEARPGAWAAFWWATSMVRPLSCSRWDSSLRSRFCKGIDASGGRHRPWLPIHAKIS